MNIEKSIEIRLNRLRIWNTVVGLILAVQAAMIAMLTNNFSLPVTATFMSGPPGTEPELYNWFDIPTGWGGFYLPGNLGPCIADYHFTLGLPLVQT